MGTRRISWLVFVAAVLLTWPINVEAIEYTFTKVVDTNTPFPGETVTFTSMSAPSINGGIMC